MANASGNPKWIIGGVAIGSLIGMAGGSFL